jgi:hypothetical protein
MLKFRNYFSIETTETEKNYFEANPTIYAQNLARGIAFLIKWKIFSPQMTNNQKMVFNVGELIREVNVCTVLCSSTLITQYILDHRITRTLLDCRLSIHLMTFLDK